MLKLTPAAVDAVRMLVHATPVDDDTGGLRIGRVEPTADGMAYDMAIVNGPQASDEEIDSGGAFVFLAPQASESLGGSMLHARFEKGAVRFVVVDTVAP
jgi:iron-sulfur cluster assembly protein